MANKVKHVPPSGTPKVHSGSKGGETGCGFDTTTNPSHWVTTTDPITCDKDGCK